MRQHADKLTTKRGQKFALDHSDQSKKLYIKNMYNAIYDVFIEAGMARHRGTPVFLDMEILYQRKRSMEKLQPLIWWSQGMSCLPTKQA